MAEYYVWLKQRGNGCDYTIGCGQKLIKLQSGPPFVKDAILAEIGRILDETEHSECEIKEVKILVFSGPNFDLAGYHRKKTDAERTANLQKAEEVDRATYEKLKKKFER